MLIKERRQQILSLIQSRGEILVSEVAPLLGVSEVTVRSDLKALVDTGHLRRTRGGARLPLDPRMEAPLEEMQLQQRAEKRRIGRAAAALIQDGETIFLDVGSTATEVARHLPPTLREVTVVTPGLNIALELEKLPHVRVIVTGGTLRRLQHSLVSPYALEILRHVHADRLFLGCNGIDAVNGITNANHEEAEVKRCMVRYARTVVVLADHSKLGVTSRAWLASADQVQTLITSRHTTPPPAALVNLISDFRIV
ncbi:DeoR/GlpR family DNA-binding transcription regulator [Deinococcus deserti]